jgi:ligand-binding SRPBCC domain-containing protein
MHELTAAQTLPLPLRTVFAFFERPENLEAITPPFLRFRIVSPRPVEMKQDAIIDYRLRIRGVPVRWRTRITRYQPPHRFVDEQISGPYRRWVHEHTFEPATLPGGGEATIIRDRVTYELPRLPLRALVHRLLVRPDLERIFDYRADAVERALRDQAPPPPPGTAPGTPRALAHAPPSR